MNIQTKYSPPHEVVLHEVSVFRTPYDMAKVYTAGLSCSHEQFKWANGVLLNYRDLDPTFAEFFARELIEGRIHWQWVSVTLMPKYHETVKVENFVTVPVKDVSYNKKFVEIASFLKEWIQSKLQENDVYPLLIRNESRC